MLSVDDSKNYGDFMKNIWQLWLKNTWQLAKWKCSAVVFRDPLAKTKNIPEMPSLSKSFLIQGPYDGKIPF